MGDDTSVRRLVEKISAFFIEKKPVEEDLSCCLTIEFLQNMKDVLHTKQIVAYPRFQSFFDFHCERMLSSAETFLYYVFYACLHDAFINLNIFERFLSAFAIILRISLETRNKRGVDYCSLVPDVFMVFYRDELKRPLGKCGGFRRLVEYINKPNYLKSKCIFRNISCSPNPEAFFEEIPIDFDAKMTKILLKEPEFSKDFGLKPGMHDKCLILAMWVLQIVKNEFILSPSNETLKESLSDLIQREIMHLDFERRVLERDEGDSEMTFENYSNYDGETNDETAELISDNARCENIIEAVVRHNQSRSSINGKSGGRIQTETYGILKNLQRTIKSLMDVLEE